jgi:WD40 repeat protein
LLAATATSAKQPINNRFLNHRPADLDIKSESTASNAEVSQHSPTNQATNSSSVIATPAATLIELHQQDQSLEATAVEAVRNQPLLPPLQSHLPPPAQPGSPTDLKMRNILNTKKRMIHRYFDELSHTYMQGHNQDTDFTLKDSSQQVVLDRVRSTMSKITAYTEFRSVASVNYNSDMHGMSSIVSSVDFDLSYEHFAMAGVTKRIKIFDFANIVERPQGVHYPLYEMSHNAKLSCVNWNRYFRQQLACSDYEGVVSLWDAEQGTLIKSYQEHEKRCWGVQFCNVDPRLLASGSDDSKVCVPIFLFSFFFFDLILGI